jgi:phage gp36-like protein
MDLAVAMIDEVGDGPQQVQDAYDSTGPSGDSDEVEAAEEAARTVKDALADAESEVNGHLRSRYDVPVASSPSEVPRVLTRIAADIAHYRLQRDPTDAATERYDRAREDLGRLQRGQMDLGVDESGEKAKGSGPSAGVSAAPKTFTNDTLQSWRRGDNTDTYPPHH